MQQNFFEWKWIAILRDGTNIQKYKEDGTEQLFRLVLDAEKENKLKTLVLDNGRSWVSVNLITGIFYVNGMPQNPIPELSEKELEYKCIYFFRGILDMVAGSNRKIGQSIRDYNLGWKININGKVYKVIYNINAITHVITVVVNNEQELVNV